MSFEVNASKNWANTELAKEFIKAIRSLSRRGWTPATGGNFSLLLNRSPIEMLMSPSGVDKGRVKLNDLIVVSECAKVISGDGLASAETLIHSAIYKHFDAGCVLHTHSVPSTVLSRNFEAANRVTLAGYEMLKALPAVETHDISIDIPIFKNSQDILALSKDISDLFSKSSDTRAILLAGHGLYAWGTSIREAYRSIEALEFLLDVKLKELILGRGE